MGQEHAILTVNPGSTSMKIGLVRAGEVVLDENIDVAPDALQGLDGYPEQAPVREQMILDRLAERGVDLSEIDAVSGRGVGVVSVEGGTYLINDLAYEHALHDFAGIRHAATLGIVMSKDIADSLDVPAYFVNPMSTDELCDCARMTGVRGLYRPSHAHPLNMKQVAIRHSELTGVRYDQSNYVILHMGGGISVAAHRCGRAIDQTRIGDGQGPISPNRAGDICLGDVMTLMGEGRSLDEVLELTARRGGLTNLCGTADLREARAMAADGNRMAKLAIDAMEYTMVKWAAAMAGALSGEVDAVLMTGGMAYDEALVDKLTADLGWIAPVFVYPGSFETEALAAGVERVLSGREEVRHYSGKPVFSGFEG